MTDLFDCYKEVWCCDFEFQALAGERPMVHCLVAHELRSGRTIRLWADELGDHPPFSIGPDVLVVAYFASAELGCFRALGWQMPARILDIYAEFRVMTNGLPLPSGKGLLGAMVYLGIDAMAATEKSDMRDLAIRGGPFIESEKAALLDYCEHDVLALSQLLGKMAFNVDLPRALLRGRYTAAVSHMELVGVPIDVETLRLLRRWWPQIKSRLIEQVDCRYGVYEGHTFKRSRFAKWLEQQGIPWPRLESGELALDADTFRLMAKLFIEIAPLHELRQTLAELRLEALTVGQDGRNRTLLSPFISTTSRNQPSNSKFIFGPSRWIRGLIKPETGRAIAYIDWSQQEFGIAAALSGDLAMKDAYLSGDPYLTFAKQAGAVPKDATKRSHPNEREQFKTCALAVQYGMGEKSLAEKLGHPTAYGRLLLQAHKDTYPIFWKWSQAAVDQAMLYGKLWTVFGWPIHVTNESNPRSLANFPMQANGAEMLRLACCLATERGINVCCPIHDALLVEGPSNTIEQIVRETQSAMAEASRVVLNGFELRTDVSIVQWPDRYMDLRGQVVWDEVTALAVLVSDETQCATHT